MTVHIFGGGTFSHVRSHLALSAPAFGATARRLYAMFAAEEQKNPALELWPTIHLTKMADPTSQDSASLVTNDDVAARLDRLIERPDTRVIIMNAALCDYTGNIVEEFPDDLEPGMFAASESGKYHDRLKTSEGNQLMGLTPADKLIGRIRKTRKDIFLVGFKTTTSATSGEQYLAGLNLLKANSCNLVVANDTVTRNNMIIAPEETRYFETTDRAEVLRGLVEMVLARMTNTFTRSTVVAGRPVDFQNDTRVPDNLRIVVNHLIARGAYRAFRNATAGHFAVRLGEGRCLTSRRKTNYNEPGGLDLVEVEYDGLDKVIAHGAKPSVGGQSQRIIFEEHGEVDCIAHAHISLKDNPRDVIPVSPQWPNECGSSECGKSTSRNLADFGDLKAVMLEGHGPNIVFSRNTPASRVIDFIEANFDIERKTGGAVELAEA